MEAAESDWFLIKSYLKMGRNWFEAAHDRIWLNVWHVELVFFVGLEVFSSSWRVLALHWLHLELDVFEEW